MFYVLENSYSEGIISGAIQFKANANYYVNLNSYADINWVFKDEVEVSYFHLKFLNFM